jgi:hypothetical protein
MGFFFSPVYEQEPNFSIRIIIIISFQLLNAYDMPGAGVCIHYFHLIEHWGMNL